MKMIKFKDLQTKINELSEKYQIAKENNDEKTMDEVQYEYELIREKLCTYRDKLNKKSTYKLKKENQRVDISEEEKDKNERILKVKAIYNDKLNKQFINIVGKSEDIRDFYKRKNQKKVNFVKRHFEKFALATAGIVLIGVGLVSCGKNKKDDVKEQTTIVSTETTTENKNDETVKVTENNKETEISNNNEASYLIKLKPLSTVDKENINSNKKADEDYKNDDNTKKANEVKINYNIGKDGKKEVVVEQMDPGVGNSDSGKKTTTTVKKEETKKEKDPVDYKTEIIDNTKKKKTETTTVIKKDKKKKVETENLPIEGATEEKPKDYKPGDTKDIEIPETEKVTIEVQKETEKINPNVPVAGENEVTHEEQNNKNTTEKTENEIVIVIEDVQPTEINYGVPVDDTSAYYMPVGDTSTMESSYKLEYKPYKMRG